MGNWRDASLQLLRAWWRSFRSRDGVVDDLDSAIAVPRRHCAGDVLVDVATAFFLAYVLVLNDSVDRQVNDSVPDWVVIGIHWCRAIVDISVTKSDGIAQDEDVLSIVCHCLDIERDHGHALWLEVSWKARDRVWRA